MCTNIRKEEEEARDALKDVIRRERERDKGMREGDIEKKGRKKESTTTTVIILKGRTMNVHDEEKRRRKRSERIHAPPPDTTKAMYDTTTRKTNMPQSTHQRRSRATSRSLFSAFLSPFFTQLL
jgi:hypothetical protein